MENTFMQQNETVAISKEDIANIKNFFSNFEIPLSDELVAAMAAFEKEETFQNQQRVKHALCEVFITSGHEAFRDQLFNPAVGNSTKILYEENFDKDLVNTLEKKPSEE